MPADKITHLTFLPLKAFVVVVVVVVESSIILSNCETLITRKELKSKTKKNYVFPFI